MIADPLEAGRRAGLDRAVVRFERVIADVMLIDNPLDSSRLARAALAPLAGHGALLETLRTYLTTGLSIRRTADKLDVHENTVSYRIRRIVALLDAESAAELVRVDILLALRATELGIG